MSLDIESLPLRGTDSRRGDHHDHEPPGQPVFAVKGSDKSVRVLLSIASFLCVVATGVLIASVFYYKEPPLQFLVVGDWGREGMYNQSEVAELMARVMGASPINCDKFIISTGDNFYPNGLNSSEDALFSTSFSSVYSQPSLRSIPWYAVLGNHDYGDGFEYCQNDEKKPCHRSPSYQLGAALMDRDIRWNCNRFYTRTFGNVELFFIDTSPFIARYRTESWAAYPGGILEQSWVDQLKELEVRLSRSNAAWKIVVGHHPPRSNGDHGNNSELMQYLEPVLHAGGVQIYFSGHDHDLEHLYVEELGINYFVSGGGSQCDRNFVSNASSMWQYPSSGFLEAQVHRKDIKVTYYTLETKDSPAYSTVITLRS